MSMHRDTSADAESDGSPAHTESLHDLHLDGNAAAGLLGEVFAFDVTVSLTSCAGCGAVNHVGAAVAYLHGMGAVLRCPGCGDALIRIARIAGRYRLDLRGVSYLEVAPSAP
jgi:hypothetical protein